MRPRPVRVLPALLLLTVLGCAQATGGQSHDPRTESRTSAGTRPGAWTRLEDAPLSPRVSPVAGFLEGRAVFAGGDTGPPCPPNADCVQRSAYAVDGAAYDPERKTWTRIKDAPVGIPDHAPHAVIGAHLFVRVEGRLLDYDAGRDRWTTTAVPGPSPDWISLTPDGTRLVLTSGSDEEVQQPDQVLDTRTGDWTVLPDDPLGLSFDRAITATDEGLVLTAHHMDASGSPDDPALVRAALLPRGAARWTRFPDSDQLGGGEWTWMGRRMVDATPGGADGGEVNGYRRTIPFGGTLDPATGTWSRLPNTPSEGTRGWPAYATGGPVLAAAGWLYDDSARMWTTLGRPDDAPPSPGVALWARDTLLVLGGSDYDAAEEPGQWTAERVYSTGFWATTLAANQFCSSSPCPRPSSP